MVSNWHQSLDYKLIREHDRLKINISQILVAVKRLWSHSKSMFTQNLYFLTPRPCPSLFILHVIPLPPQHIFNLVSYPTLSQKKIQNAYENRGVKREKKIIFLNST